MSVLTTTNTGILKEIKDYFDNFIIGDGPLKQYTYYKNRDGIYCLTLYSQFRGSVITLDGKDMPKCYVEFTNNPYTIFTRFNTPEDFEKIDKHFYLNTYRYVFRFCSFTEEKLKMMIHCYRKIEDSFIFVPKDFFNILEKKYNITRNTFLRSILDNRNALYVNENEPGQEPNYITCQRKDIEKYLDIVTKTI